MLKKFTLFLTLIMSVSVAIAQQGTLKGEVLDGDNSEGVPFATVKLIQNGTVKGGANTDFDGKFTISSITPGSYDVEVNAVGYTPQRISGVVISGDKIRFLTGSDAIKMPSGSELEEVVITEYSVPLIDKDGGASGGTITREDIAKLPGRSAAAVASTVGGVGTDANGNISSVRGARSNATYYYIDGIKVRGSSGLPKSAIQEVSVITGGLPANYGDATGGIISVTTRGPSSFYFGGVDYLTSGFKIGEKTYGLDNYGYNLLEGSISGPLYSRTDSSGNKEPLLGFFLAANLTSIIDSRPFAVDQYKLKDSVRGVFLGNDSVPGNIISVINGDQPRVVYATDFLRRDDFEIVKFRQNSARKGASGSGKIDVNLGPTMNLTFGGSLDWNNSRGHDWARSALNSENNPLTTNLSWRAYSRFTQRFENDVDEEGNERKGGVKNVFYTVMADFSKSYSKTEDETFGDDFFKYGYIGKFEKEYYPNYSLDEDGNYNFSGYGSLIKYVADSIPSNPVLSNAAQQVFDYASFDPHESFLSFQNIYTAQALNGLTNDGYVLESNYLTNQGLLNGQSLPSVYSMWQNMGITNNGYSISDNSQFRFTGSGSANVGNHALTLGFEFEQRDDRYFSLAPSNLWGLARLLSNTHIEDLDPSKPWITYNGTTGKIDYPKLNSSPGEYGGADDSQSFFDYNMREALNWNTDGTAFINPDEYDPSIFSLSMFAPDELFNSGNSSVAYAGYDHTGKKVKNNSSYEDFYTQLDDYGNYSRPINSFQPIYMSGYIMDKFAFNDLIFNVGLRVDRFDANQPVLKDKYLFAPAYTKEDLPGESWTEDLTIPTNVPNDAIVYVDDSYDPSSINGYRSGDVWYNAEGVQVSDPTLVYSGTSAAPWLDDVVEENHTGIYVSDDGSALKDYDPQITVMPRVSFSFPISDEALFFAHYDVLAQRPGNIRFDPLTYLYIEGQSLGSPITNPNLRPEKTIDYELGFQQVLSKSSSLKIATFYREQRDFIAAINVIGAYPTSYTTYGNIDFGTVKGMTLTYDLRRTGNVRLNASYTLQFADGTGSSSTSGLNFLQAGVPNFRTISPYSYDQRHAFSGSIDYRYGEGKDYNGPVVKGKQIFKNSGANMSFNFGSGTPYNAQSNITPGATGAGSSQFTGTINGSRKPWQYRFDTQLDRNVTIKRGEGDDAKNPLNLNIYLQINNIFNIVNVVNVYGATGNPDDDGYLNTAEAQRAISQENSYNSYIELYNMKIVNPYNYSLPRTIRLGIKLDF